MEEKKINELLEKIGIPFEDGQFSMRLFREIDQEYGEISRNADISGIQEGCAIRNILKTREMAIAMINDDGKLEEPILEKYIKQVSANLYSLDPSREADAKRNERIIRVLNQLKSDKALVKALNRVGKPHMHKYADQIIRDTLNIPPKTIVTDAHARRAALSALLCFLRQNVGSCFATAPAIMVHDEQPDVFLNDLQELLSTGRLKRTFGGVEYAVPLSTSWGAGDLKRKIHASDEIWKSPGLQLAFETVGIVNKQLSLEERTWISPEEIIQLVLQDHFKISIKDIEEYENRPKGMIHGGLLMQPPMTGSILEGKSQNYEHYIQALESAKSAFKGIEDNALLKSWEFSLASFSETKSQFTRWNLYSSLGLGPNEEGGIGPCLIEILQKKLNECNEKVKEHQAEYEQLHNQLQFIQRKLKNVGSEQEAKWVRIEYQTKVNEFNLQEELRNKYHYKAQKYANFFDELVHLYDKIFPKFFQEIYDADIHEVTAGPYDDSPAGFRLVYKHGRSNTSQWTKIENHFDFIDALTNFFVASETEIAGAPEMANLQDDVSEITSSIVNHVRSNVFLETAFNRMAIAHNSPIIKDPLENLDKIEKKPWVYTSGGAMVTLVSCYFKRNEKPTDVSRWVDNPMELLVFLVDSIKEIPDYVKDEFEQNHEKALLMHSPTHAFLLKPGYSPFIRAWRNKEFTYTWIRDNLLRNNEQFCKKIYLDDEKMRFIIDHLAKKVSINYRYYFKEVFGSLGGALTTKDFREHIIDTMESTIGLQHRRQHVLRGEEIDATLFEQLPIIPTYKLKDQIQIVISELPGIDTTTQETILKIYDDISGKIGSPKLVGSKSFKELIKSLIMLATNSTTSIYDYTKLIAEVAQKHEFALPRPIIFADTNWVKDYFAFLVNPGTYQTELWRTDYTGSVGAPMAIWEQWLNGSHKTPTWGIYPKRVEYKF